MRDFENSGTVYAARKMLVVWTVHGNRHSDYYLSGDVPGRLSLQTLSLLISSTETQQKECISLDQLHATGLS